MKKILIGLFLIFSTALANAGAPSVGTSTVLRYLPKYGTHAYVKLDIPHLNRAGCSSSFYYVLHNTHPEFEEYRKLILTAKASGLKIGIYVWEDAGRCIGPYPEIHAIFIQ